jgi:hypothetical protein
MLDIAERVKSSAYLEGTDLYSMNAGRMITLLEMGEEGIFEALNGLSSYGDDKTAEKYAVHVGRGEVVALEKKSS